jgi:hypothetical protein
VLTASFEHFAPTRGATSGLATFHAITQRGRRPRRRPGDLIVGDAVGAFSRALIHDRLHVRKVPQFVGNADFTQAWASTCRSCAGGEVERVPVRLDRLKCWDRLRVGKAAIFRRQMNRPCLVLETMRPIVVQIYS